MRIFRTLAFVGALLGFAFPAMASNPLWFGGEDTSVNSVGSNTTTITSTFYNPTYSRMALVVANSTTVADPPANRYTMNPTTFSAVSSLWFHANFYIQTNNNTTLNEQGLIFRSPDGVSRVLLRQTGTAGTLKLSIANAARSFTDLVTLSAITATANHTLDIQLPYTCGGGDVTNIYVDTALVGTYTGSLCTDSATTLNAVELASFNNGATTNGTYWSQILVDTVDTRSEVVYTLTTGTSGATQNCTPNTPANVNKAQISDTSFVSTSANNTICEFGGATSAPTGVWAVRAVSIEERLLISTTGPQNAEFIAHVSGSDYTGISGCSNPTLTNSFANYRCQMNVSPATGLVWGINEVFNSGANLYSFGFESLM